MKQLDKVYNPRDVEERWNQRWLDNNLFTAGRDTEKPSFSMVIPPPNITGSLHMGHALNNTLQDILARYKRMKGFDVLWLPGTDHAGIATQNVVEKILAEEGIDDKRTLGRGKFIERVWSWKESSGGKIVNQLKRLGASCDWSREQFTMSPGLNKAVREVFVRLYEEGLIYRDERLINWCPRCLTALSDIEVEHEDVAGKLYYIRYHFIDDPDMFVTVATTRPETMLGDTAVAVHPDDDRFKGLIGKEVLLPLTNRRIPIIADSMVDMEFGTGAVKITPAHDFNDFEVGARHGLKRIAIFDERAHMKVDIESVDRDVLEVVSGLHAQKAREKVIHILKEKGFITNMKDHPHAVGRCYRCKTIVEPFISPQWFVKVGPLAEEAIRSVEEGETRFIPKGWENTYFNWMRNIKDWCISRQIWWGHQVPAWYCIKCNEEEITDIKGEKVFSATAKVTVSRTEPSTCLQCGGKEFIRDSDVLDTWFSSALWPFSTLGWPDKTNDLARYYPTVTLVTGFDIIFFWVARMLMMGIKFMGDSPFKDVYIHALVRDAEGQKMSKSKGNVIDPLTVMDQFGTDALRFTLSAMASQGRDIKLAEERIEGYRNFCNKIWNLARFTLMNIEDLETGADQPKPECYSLADKWLLSRLDRTVGLATEAMEGYRFNEVANVLYQFVWHELCDWYLEMIKGDLRGDSGDEKKSSAQIVLKKALLDSVKLLHPIMPFITEEIWDVMTPAETDGKSSIMNIPYPTQCEMVFPEAEADMAVIMDVIKAIRNLRGEMNLPPSAKLEIKCRVGEERIHQILLSGKGYIGFLAKVSNLEISLVMERPEGAVSQVVKGVEIFLPLEGVLDVEHETKRLNKEMEKVSKEIEGIDRRLNNDNFLAKAPKDVVEKDRTRHSELLEKMGKVEDCIRVIMEIRNR